MTSRRQILKTLLIIPVTFIMSVDNFLYAGTIEITISELLILKMFERVQVGDVRVFVLVIDKLIYMFLFNILYGNLISEEFRYNSIYVFSRLKSRKVWFVSKCVRLFLISMLYSLIFLACNLLICTVASVHRIYWGDINLVMILFIIISFMLMLTTLLINMISIRFGNGTGFILTYLVIVILLFMSLQGQSFMGSFRYLLLLNPMSSINIDIIENKIFLFFYIIYYFMLITATVLLGARFVNKQDIALYDAEEK